MLSPARRLCYQFFQSNPDPNLVFRHWPVTVLRSVACGQGQAFRQHLAVFEGAVEDPRAELPCGRVTVPSLFWLPGLPHTSMSVSTLPTPRPFHISSDFFQILCSHSWFGWPICTPGAWRMTPDLANDKIGDWCVVGQLCLPRSGHYWFSLLSPITSFFKDISRREGDIWGCFCSSFWTYKTEIVIVV